MVVIILGSKSDLEWGQTIGKHLSHTNIAYIIHVASAHKTPELVLSIIQKYDSKNTPNVYICVAGRSNALGGFVDANTVSPVINCPPSSSSYAGLDILSSLRMPTGVAPMTVLEPDQAALAAAKILSINDINLKKKVINYQNEFKNKITKDNRELNKIK